MMEMLPFAVAAHEDMAILSVTTESFPRLQVMESILALEVIIHHLTSLEPSASRLKATQTPVREAGFQLL